VRSARRRKPLFSRVDGGARPVYQASHLARLVDGRATPHVDQVVPHGPLEGRLQLEPCRWRSSSLAVIRSGGLGGHVFYSVGILHVLGVTQVGAAGMTERRLLIEMAGSTSLADAKPTW